MPAAAQKSVCISRHVDEHGRISRITSRGMHALAARLTNLERLDLGDIPFTDDHQHPLDLSSLTRLRHLDLSLVTLLGFVSVCLRGHDMLNSLERLDLDHPFTDGHKHPLDLSSLTRLRHLDLSLVSLFFQLQIYLF